MTTKDIQRLLISAFVIGGLCGGCKKQQDDFLNVKKFNSDVSPTTLQDFQALLDNDDRMNGSYPTVALAGTDNIYMTGTAFNNLVSNDPVETQTYLWAKDINQGAVDYEWSYAYQRIEYANICLDGIQKVSPDPTSQAAYNNVKGSALFYRAYTFFNLVSKYAKVYTAATAATDPGIPLRQTSDGNAPSSRATVQQSYDQIINDLKTAENLLPATAIYTRPSVIAVDALLAKVYLSMEDYVNAGKYADKALSGQTGLIDFNTLNAALTQPFPTNASNNPEIIYYAEGLGYSSIAGRIAVSNIDSFLYASYGANDLRKVIFYVIRNGLPQVKATYCTNAVYNFAGLATNELYLIRAESNARAGNTAAAMQDLDTLLIKRYVRGTFVSLTAASADDALVQVLQERRKELAFTGFLRWEDLRRLNKDSRFAITLKRVVNGAIYTLAPNDLNYVFPLPDIEVQLGGEAQNPRN